jgi:hypothetical protein
MYECMYTCMYVCMYVCSRHSSVGTDETLTPEVNRQLKRNFVGAVGYPSTFVLLMIMMKASQDVLCKYPCHLVELAGAFASLAATNLLYFAATEDIGKENNRVGPSMDTDCSCTSA